MEILFSGKKKSKITSKDKCSMTNTVVQESSEFLKAVLRFEIDFSSFYSSFEKLENTTLEYLSNTEKLIVWVNLYNALMQIELKNMQNETVDKSIFSKKIFKIAGQQVSLDEIEHGILRRNKLKQALGYLSGSYLNSVTKKWMCDVLDARLHFQLNCGAVSCPMIHVLTEANIEIELREGERDFLRLETDINHEKKLLIISRLFLFYRKDFGGKAKIKSLVNQFHAFPTYKLKYKRWNWKIHSFKIK